MSMNRPFIPAGPYRDAGAIDDHAQDGPAVSPIDTLYAALETLASIGVDVQHITLFERGYALMYSDGYPGTHRRVMEGRFEVDGPRGAVTIARSHYDR